MRLVREVTAEEEGFRLVSRDGNIVSPRRNGVEPEPVGTLLLVPMRIVGYDPDCDGSLMARLDSVSLDQLDEPISPEILNASMREAESFGVHTRWGLYPETGIVATPDEIRALAAVESPEA